jgi:omega-amidase
MVEATQRISQHRVMKVVCCQLDIVWEDKEANFSKVESMAARANLPAGSLFVLPEMFATGFSFNLGLTAENPGGRTESFMAGLARKFSIYVAGGLVSFRDSQPSNQAVLFSPKGELIDRYSKIFLFSGADEHIHHAAGSRIPGFELEGFHAAMFICYDLRFPEIFRSSALKGVELMIVIANWPVVRIQHWITLLQARAIENQACVVGVNRAGQDPALVYPGRSVIVDPHGNIMTDGGSGEGLISADLDFKEVRDWRRIFPALRDIRKEFLSQK